MNTPNEIFTYPINNETTEAQNSVNNYECRFIGKTCDKQSRTINYPMGVCSVNHGKNKPIICPHRFLEDNIVFKNICESAFGTTNNVLLFKEVKLNAVGAFDFVFDDFEIPFAITVLISLALIFAYTYRGGLKTIIITDTLQTFFLVSSVFLTIIFICNSLDLGFIDAFETVKESQYSKVFFFEDYLKGNYFWKQILGGIFVTIAMVGLDQDLMQKNLSCATIGEAHAPVPA